MMRKREEVNEEERIAEIDALRTRSDALISSVNGTRRALFKWLAPEGFEPSATFGAGVSVATNEDKEYMKKILMYGPHSDTDIPSCAAQVDKLLAQYVGERLNSIKPPDVPTKSI